MSIQTLRTPSGDEMVVMSRREYIALLASAGDEDAEDVMTVIIANERRDGPKLSAEETKALFDDIMGRHRQTAAE
jgi:hypothetical protein